MTATTPPIRTQDSLVIVDLGETQALIDTSAGAPVIRHLGAPLLDVGDSVPAPWLFDRPRPASTLAATPDPTVVPDAAAGWMGRPGLRGQRTDGTGRASATAPRFSGPDRKAEVEARGSCCRIEVSDPVAELTLITAFSVSGGALRIEVAIRNDADSPYQLHELTTTVPVPARADELLHLTGRWAHEFQPQRQPWSDGAVGFDNRRGRSSHDRPPFLAAGTTGFGENHGDVWGFGLAWSSNTIVGAEALSDGTRVVQLGAAWATGEVTIEPGATFVAPAVIAAASIRGLNGVSQALHKSIRARPGHPGSDRPRPVTLNTWEALYFDHDPAKLRALAERAARVGCERFVLDDGWFLGRRAPSAGLGDWTVDPAVHPNGLGPLIAHVRDLGMEFGLWIEPEMVNRDSDLYRAHPDWVLADDPDHAVEGRDQLVLDLGRSEVRDHLVAEISTVLSDHDIAFVKWDMNRDLAPVSDRVNGSLHAHQLGVYDVWDRIRAAHPDVEFESCASGGGRADLAMLARAERVWTSDTNDPLERQRIQRGFSIVFPPEVMGAHIGPPRSHTTGRTHPLGFRAATALFGHLGIEWNLLELDDADLVRLAAVVAEHQRLRPVLHGGTTWRLDVDDPAALAHVVVAPDQDAAVLSFCQFDRATTSVPTWVRVAGLDPERVYRASVVELDSPPTGACERQVGWIDGSDDSTATGRVLAELGLPMPILHPESALVVHLEAVAP